MNKYISDQIDKITHLQSKQIAKDVLNRVFLELYDTCEKKYSDLEQRVRDEIVQDDDCFDIYATVMQKDLFDRTSSFLRPMLPEDLAPPKDRKTIQQEIDATGESWISSLFCELDYLQCVELLKNHSICQGYLISGNSKIPARFAIRRADRYLRCVEKLYSLFCSNHMAWRTVNHPYLMKFIDIYVVEFDKDANLPFDAPVACEVPLRKYDAQTKIGLLPLWNVENHFIKSDDFPLPVINTMNFEYRFSLTQLGVENGYLADGGDNYILTTRREKDQFIIVSPVEQNKKWNLYSILQKKESRFDNYRYPLITNRRDHFFSDHLSKHYGYAMKTKADIEKMLASFEVSAELSFHSYELVDASISGETYDMNGFIADEIRDISCKKTLMLRFQANSARNYLQRDIMSFLVSAVQLSFPDFRCVGVLL